MSFCHRCGTRLNSECLFCIKCGARVLTEEDIEKSLSSVYAPQNDFLPDDDDDDDYEIDQELLERVIAETELELKREASSDTAQDGQRIVIDDGLDEEDEVTVFDDEEDDDDPDVINDDEEPALPAPALSPLCNSRPERKVYNYGLKYRYFRGLDICSYNGALYCVVPDKDEIWQIEDETNIVTRKIELKKQIKKNEALISVFVNDTGIYALSEKSITRNGDEYVQYRMLHLGLDGEYRRDHTLGTTKKDFTAAYMNRDTLYYSINNRLVEYRFVSCSEYELLKRSPRSSGTISSVYASDSFVVFNDENYDKDDDRYGWTLYNKSNGDITYLETHFSIKTWQDTGLKIGAFDMQKDLIWLYDKDAKTMQAYSLKTLKPADERIWHFADMDWTNAACRYFDGEVMYSVPTYYKMFAYDADGNKYTWLDGMHGCCEVFRVLNDRLHVNMEGCYSPAMVYPKTAEKQKALYKSPFDLSQ